MVGVQCIHSSFTLLRDWISAASCLEPELLLTWDSCCWGQHPMSQWTAPANPWNLPDFKAAGRQGWTRQASRKKHHFFACLARDSRQQEKERLGYCCGIRGAGKGDNPMTEAQERPHIKNLTLTDWPEWENARLFFVGNNNKPFL